MAQTSGFWTTSGAGSGDQVAGYTQAHFSKALGITAAVGRKDGVAAGYLNGLALTSTTNQVTVGTGGALVDGKWYENTASVDTTIVSSGAGTTRIDRIILQADWSAFTVRIVRLAGTDAASPTAPALTQTSGTTYEVSLCQVLVNSAGAVTVTDERNSGATVTKLLALKSPDGDDGALIASAGTPLMNFTIPIAWNGAVLTSVAAAVYTPSSSGAVTVKVKNGTDSTDMLSTDLTIDATEYNSYTAATAAVVNAAYDDVVTGDRIQIYCTGAGTDTKGLDVVLSFSVTS